MSNPGVPGIVIGAPPVLVVAVLIVETRRV